MSLIVLDAIFFLVDYLSFLFEPLILRLYSKLHIKLNGPPNAKPKVRPQREYSARGLNEEINDFYKQNELTREDGQSLRESQLDQCRRLVTSKWPWISYNCVSLDPIVNLLNWTGSDIYLIGDWDFPFVMPNLELIFREQATLASSAASTRNIIQVLAVEPKSKRIKLKLLTPKLDINSQTTTTTTTTGSSTHNSIVTLQWCSVGEYLSFESRSSLIFQYTQLYPELASLYLIICELLESAQILEPKSSSWNQNWGQAPRSNGVDFNITQLSTRCVTPEMEAANKVSRQLDRYALLLMIVAHLSSLVKDEQGGRGKRDSDDARVVCKQYSLASNLLGFLQRYSRLAPAEREVSLNNDDVECVVKPKDQATPTKLDVIFNSTCPNKANDVEKSQANNETEQDPLATGQRQLVVLDPIVPIVVRATGDDSTLEVRRKEVVCGGERRNHFSPLVNLTKDLDAAQFGALCGKLARHLELIFTGPLEPALKKGANFKGPAEASVLLDLFALCKESSLLFNQSDSRGACGSGGGGSGSGGDGNERRNANGKGNGRNDGNEVDSEGDSKKALASVDHATGKQINVMTLRHRASGVCGINKLAVLSEKSSDQLVNVGVASGLSSRRKSGNSCDIDPRLNEREEIYNFDSTESDQVSRQNGQATSKLADKRRKSSGGSSRRSSMSPPMTSPQSLSLNQVSYFNRRTLFKNLLYLALFLLVRNLVLNYLDYLRASIRDQAREDLLELKRQMMASSSDGDFWYETDFDRMGELEKIDGSASSFGDRNWRYEQIYRNADKLNAELEHFNQYDNDHHHEYDEIEDIEDLLSNDPKNWPTEWNELLMERLVQIQERRKLFEQTAARAFAASSSTFSTFATVEAKDQPESRPPVTRSSGADPATKSASASSQEPPPKAQSNEDARPAPVPMTTEATKASNTKASGGGGGGGDGSSSTTSTDEKGNSVTAERESEKQSSESQKSERATKEAATTTTTTTTTTNANVDADQTEAELKQLAESMKALSGLMGQLMAKSLGSSVERAAKLANGLEDDKDNDRHDSQDAENGSASGAEVEQLLELLGSGDGLVGGGIGIDDKRKNKRVGKSQKGSEASGGSELERLDDDAKREAANDDDAGRENAAGAEVDLEEMLEKLLSILGSPEGQEASGGLNIDELLSGLGDLGNVLKSQEGQQQPSATAQLKVEEEDMPEAAGQSESPRPAGKQMQNKDNSKDQAEKEVWDEQPTGSPQQESGHDEL